MVTKIEFAQALTYITWSLLCGGIVFLVLGFIGFARGTCDHEEWEFLSALDKIDRESLRRRIGWVLVVAFVALGVIQLCLGIWLGLVLYLV